MNMLSNKVPFGLLSEDDKELFRKYISSCYVLQVNGGFCAFLSGASINQTHTFRIKLKESEWYKVSDNRKANPVIVQYTPDSKVDGCFENGTKSDSFYGKDEITAIRPATPIEIEAIKPKMIKDKWYKVNLDLMSGKDVVFLKFDKLDGDMLRFTEKVDKGYHRKNNNWLNSGNVTSFIEVDFIDIVIKPKESFVDVEIEWNSKLGEYPKCRMPNDHGSLDITNIPVGRTLDGWCLQSFIHQESSMCSNMPICFGQGSVRHAAEILSKATHARFCKVITNATQY